MHFKIDENLKIIAAAKGDTPEAVSHSFCDFMISQGWFQDDPENYGLPILECFFPRYIDDICEMLAKYLQKSPVPIEVFDAFGKLFVRGEGNCPHCGGNLRYLRSEGHDLKDGDYWTPSSYEVDWWYYECPICGEVIKSRIEL